MRVGLLAAGCVAALVTSAWAQATVPASLAAETPAAAMTASAARGLLDEYCVRCHNQRSAIGRDTGVLWDAVDLTR